MIISSFKSIVWEATPQLLPLCWLLSDMELVGESKENPSVLHVEGVMLRSGDWVIVDPIRTHVDDLDEILDLLQRNLSEVVPVYFAESNAIFDLLDFHIKLSVL